MEQNAPLRARFCTGALEKLSPAVPTGQTPVHGSTWGLGPAVPVSLAQE